MALLGAAAIATWVHPSDACSQVWPPLTFDGYPADGATGVPTDVIPLFDSMLLGFPATNGPHRFRLRSAGGEEIPLTLSDAYHWYLALTPQAELAPNSEYTLEATVAAPSGVETALKLVFTTGDGPSEAPSAVAGAYLEHYRVTKSESTCSKSTHGTCVVVPPGSFVTAADVDEFGQEHDPYLYSGPTFTDLSGIEQGTNFRCVRLRTRAPNGAESDPVELCGADALLYEYQGTSDSVTCTAEGLTFDGRPAKSVSEPVRDSSSGCAFSGAPARGGAVWLGLVGLVGLARFRRARDRAR